MKFESSSRVEWVDNLKAVGIFLVVLGHLNVPEYIGVYIYSFHMPLFFFLSGVTFSVKKNNPEVFIKKRFRRLFIPYLFFSVVSYFFWLFVGRNYGVDSDLDVDWFLPIVGFFYGNNYMGFLSHNPPLWFLPCLFLTEIAFFLFLSNFGIKILLLFSIVFLILMGGTSSEGGWVWAIDVVPYSIIYFVFGYCFSRYFKGFYINKFCSVVLSFVLFFGFIFSSELNGKVDLNMLDFGNFYLYLITSFLGIFSLLIFIRNLFPNLRLGNIGKNTLVIFGLHGIILSVLKGFLYFVLGVGLDILDGSLFYNSILAISAILLLLFVGNIINFYFPYLLGNSR